MNRYFKIACFFSIFTQTMFIFSLERGAFIGIYNAKNIADIVMAVLFIFILDPFIAVVAVFFIASCFYKAKTLSFVFLAVLTMFGLAFAYIAVLALYT